MFINPHAHWTISYFQFFEFQKIALTPFCKSLHDWLPYSLNAHSELFRCVFRPQFNDLRSLSLSSVAEFVRNGRSSRALDWSAVAACRAEAGFRVNQTIITHFYVIFTSLLPVMTVIMILLLHIFTTLLRHYYVLIRMLLHHYYLLLL